MYKKIAFFALFSLSLSQANSEPIYLTSPVIEFLDGMSWGINGEAIGYMRQVGLNIIKMQYGIIDGKTNTRVGIFVFKGKKYFIKELIELNKSLCTTADSSFVHATLKQCLSDVVEYFIDAIEPFMGQARGSKSQVTVLIMEWAVKRNRNESDLLHWAETSESQEFDELRKRMTSFEKVDTFCTDLVLFLGDLIRSCPQANKQFEKLKENFLAHQK